MQLPNCNLLALINRTSSANPRPEAMITSRRSLQKRQMQYGMQSWQKRLQMTHHSSVPAEHSILLPAGTHQRQLPLPRLHHGSSICSAKTLPSQRGAIRHCFAASTEPITACAQMCIQSCVDSQQLLELPPSAVVSQTK